MTAAPEQTFNKTPKPPRDPRPSLPRFDPAAIRGHVEMLHQLAAGIDGLLVLAVLGENPDTGQNVVKQVLHFRIGDVDGMASVIGAYEATPHANCFAPLAVFRKGLARGKKGEEADVVASLGLVLDSDDDKGAAAVPPVEPDVVIETSAGNRQFIILFDRPLPMAEAKQLGEALHRAAGGDPGTKDMAHVWRLSGCLNWPSRAKVQRGRPREPQPVQVIKTWNGTLTPVAELQRVLAKELAEIAKAERPRPNGHDGTPRAVPEIMSSLPKGLRYEIAAPPEPNEDRSRTLGRVVWSLMRHDLTDDEIRMVVEAHPAGVGAKHLMRRDLPREIERLRTKYNTRTGTADSTAEAPADNTAKAEPSVDNVNDGSSPKPAFILYDEIEANPRKVWLVEALLGAAEFSAFYGKPSSGKSALAEDLGLHVAAGREWLGREVAQGAVVFVAAERASVVKRRAAAFRIKHDLHNLPFAVVPGPIDLRDPAEAERLRTIIRQVEAATGQTVVLVIIDTVNRALAGGDENSPKDMGALINSVGLIQAGDGPHVLAVHHIPLASNERMRGHGSLEGACDTTVRVEKGATYRIATLDKCNDAEEGQMLTFALERVEVGRDAKGKITSAPVVVPIHRDGNATSAGRGPTLPDKYKLALEILCDCIVEIGQPIPSSFGIPGNRRCVSLDEWRDALFRRGGLDRDAGNPRDAFRRLKLWLQSRHLIGEQEGLIWPCS